MTHLFTNKWDRRFISLAEHVSQWSRDPSTQVGAVIVRPDKTICSVGFNGFPRGMRDNPDLYSDRDLKYDRVIHAEMNAILNSPEQVKDYTMYTWPLPTCSRCAVHIIQAGIKRVVFPPMTKKAMSRWQSAYHKALAYYAEAGVKVFEMGERDAKDLLNR